MSGAALAATVVLGACGSSSGSRSASTTLAGASASTTVPTPTKAEWLAAAQRLCDKYNQQIGAIGGGAHDPATRNATSVAIIGLVRQHVAEDRALGYPPGDRATLEPIFDGMDRALAQLQQSGPHPNVQQAILQAIGSYVTKLQAYGSC
jgi:hypothetical protein